MNTRSVNSAAGVILAAMQQNRTAAGIALALESAGLLMSPEAAADLASVSTDAVSVAERAVGELKREHEENARLRQELAHSQGTQPELGTLPAWLYHRFVPVAGAPAWESLTNGDRAYWEHQARAVQRAVARGGFKRPDSTP
jgi:hypothetical protein